MDPKFGYNKKKKQAKIENAIMEFLRSVAGYAGKDQIRNIKIRGELSIHKRNNRILRSR
jgi:hypothetical protein